MQFIKMPTHKTDHQLRNGFRWAVRARQALTLNAGAAAVRSRAFPLCVLVALLLTGSSVVAAPKTSVMADSPPVGASVAGFTQIIVPGFGDRNNSWAWAMQWWNGYLYVGTNRAWHCAETYSLTRQFPTLFPYPPDDPDVECPENPNEMQLAAEIWRYSPLGKMWERVYRSPNDVHIPGTVGYTVARDVGFRGMAVFQEPDGTEALYVGSVSPRFIWDKAPPPRILRSTDGVNFAPVPQDPGSVLYELVESSLRNPVIYQDKIFFISGTVQGSGPLLAASNPAGGNDEFQIVSPPATIVSAAAVYNGYLYIGVQDLAQGYSILKTDASGPPPYTYTQVVGNGGYLTRRPNHEVLAMEVFDGRLYIGGNGIRGSLAMGLGGPAEMIRINPDDSWDLIMGEERETPTGWKFPISGFMPGFGNFFNGHIWRMIDFDGQLFVGTFDASTVQKDNPERGPTLRPVMGFDLYRSANGRDFVPVTRTGFGDKFNFGVRSLEVTPYGLFLGTANYYYGLQIWQLPSADSLADKFVYLPLLSGGTGNGAAAAAAVNASVATPQRVEALARDGDALLVWDAAPGAQRYQIWRATPLTSEVEGEMVDAGWGDATLAGETADLYWVDSGAGGSNDVYYVMSQGPNLAVSGPSNLAVVRPSSVRELMAELDAMAWNDPDAAGWSGVKQMVERAVTGEALDTTSEAVARLQQRLEDAGQGFLPAWRAKDAIYLLQKLQRRIALAQANLIPFSIE
ncbi:MAG: hypothetical protein DCC57_02975 [Chloroflexi bacterium]|nr:MAG: hypothetical protein DCC57_02975 [Chloroflexota bacterium]